MVKINKIMIIVKKCREKVNICRSRKWIQKHVFTVHEILGKIHSHKRNAALAMQ